MWAVHEPRRQEPAPGVDLACLGEVGRLFEAGIRADPADEAVVHRDGGVLEEAGVRRALVAGGDERVAHGERGPEAVRAGTGLVH